MRLVIISGIMALQSDGGCFQASHPPLLTLQSMNTITPCPDGNTTYYQG
jgi:hypothetical protein